MALIALQGTHQPALLLDKLAVTAQPAHHKGLGIPLIAVTPLTNGVAPTDDVEIIVILMVSLLINLTTRKQVTASVIRKQARLLIRGKARFIVLDCDTVQAHIVVLARKDGV